MWPCLWGGHVTQNSFSLSHTFWKQHACHSLDAALSWRSLGGTKGSQDLAWLEGLVLTLRRARDQGPEAPSIQVGCASLGMFWSNCSPENVNLSCENHGSHLIKPHARTEDLRLRLTWMWQLPWLWTAPFIYLLWHANPSSPSLIPPPNSIPHLLKSGSKTSPGEVNSVCPITLLREDQVRMSKKSLHRKWAP